MGFDEEQSWNKELIDLVLAQLILDNLRSRYESVTDGLRRAYGNNFQAEVGSEMDLAKVCYARMEQTVRDVADGKQGIEHLAFYRTRDAKEFNMFLDRAESNLLRPKLEKVRELCDILNTPIVKLRRALIYHAFYNDPPKNE